MENAEAWKRVAAVPAALPAVQPEVDTYVSAGQLSVSLDAETTRLLLGEVPAAFHAGVQDILVIAFGLAWSEFLGTGGTPIGIDVEGHGRVEELGGDVDLSRTVGWFTTKYPVSLTIGELSWAQVATGEAALGPVVKDAKEQIRALPDGLSYGLLRYLNADVDLAGPDPAIGFNYLGRLGAAAADLSDDLWRINQDGVSIIAAATAVPTPLGHTVELNAGMMETDTGPHLHADWTWALSALDHEQVSRVSQLWFDALAGICAHVQHGGGGLTPSDVAPARVSQQQIDELAAAIPDRRRAAADPAAAGAAVSHRHRAGQRRSVCGAAGHHRDRRPRSAAAARCGAHHGQPPSQSSGRFCEEFGEPVQIIPADPAMAWQYVDIDSGAAMSMSRSSSYAPPNAPRSATSPTSRPFGRR